MVPAAPGLVPSTSAFDSRQFLSTPMDKPASARFRTGDRDLTANAKISAPRERKRSRKGERPNHSRNVRPGVFANYRPAFFKSDFTVSEGWAPRSSQVFTLSVSTFISAGSTMGL